MPCDTVQSRSFAASKVHFLYSTSCMQWKFCLCPAESVCRTVQFCAFLLVPSNCIWCVTLKVHIADTFEEIWYITHALVDMPNSRSMYLEKAVTQLNLNYSVYKDTWQPALLFFFLIDNMLFFSLFTLFCFFSYKAFSHCFKIMCNLCAVLYIFLGTLCKMVVLNNLGTHDFGMSFLPMYIYNSLARFLQKG